MCLAFKNVYYYILFYYRTSDMVKMAVRNHNAVVGMENYVEH